MIWRSHMVIGASTWLAAAAITDSSMDTRERAIGAVIAAGGALLCDMDTPNSRLAHALGPVTQLTARLIGRAFGGHRHGTHSLIFCAAIATLSALALAQGELVHITTTVTLTTGQLAALAIGYFATALTVALLLSLRGARAAAVSLALVAVAVAATTRPPPALVSLALTIGCLSHLLADMLTPEGIEPLWPFSRRRVTLTVIKRTGDRRETLLVTAVALVTLALLAGGYP